MSSVLVAEGDPARLLGLIDPTSVLWDAVLASGAFVVHIRTAADRALAERFSEVRPPVRASFERLQVAESPWGPVLGGRRPRVACRLTGAAPVGYGQLVEGVIEQLEWTTARTLWPGCTAATGRWATSLGRLNPAAATG